MRRSARWRTRARQSWTLAELNKTLAEVDLSFKNWKLSVKWFEQLSERDLQNMREAGQMSVSCQLADAFHEQAAKGFGDAQAGDSGAEAQRDEDPHD